MSAALRLEAETGLAGLAAAQARLADWLTARGATQRLQDRAALVTEEVVLNIGMHGFDDTSPHPLAIEARLDGAALTLTFEDAARDFDPVAAPARPLPQHLEDAPVGGLGLVLLRRMTDALSHEPRPGGGNRLTAVIRAD
ncbi:ATP-binding protein [Roseomonas sp. CCTCC AB2023176]|uniref:ATP-binding protein n=1 Tax=Roseomonas sp. CCTCC AB2023176 TaxID=3342640 RepID=UPI0035D5FC1B